VDIDLIARNTQLFLIIFTRIFAMLSVAPLFSSRAIPGVARVALGLFTALMVFPWVLDAG